MKKIILAVITIMTFSFANAQDGHFKLGLNSGYPVGKADNVFSFNFGVDVMYMVNLNEKFSVGATTGYMMFVGNEYDYFNGFEAVRIDGPNASFIPVAGTFQYSLNKSIFLGADLGYAFYVGSKNGGTGGFLYQPKIGYQNAKWEIYGSYKGIENSGNVGAINIGVNYKF
ncbi:hypothetical protein [uncultured Flavobacterium sp.]|uniref:hypothetical protein n=1 Tax=uncultured Flavobacterium sp. TaxID=165435 RepID=UPI00292F5423|nr:hypothetical protein [uncultured Flavobacterium sp.]